jgi:ABC-2 type transport system permease protein
MMLARLFWREHRMLALGYTGILGAALTAATLYWPNLRDAGILTLVQYLPFEPLKEFAEGFEREGFWAYFAVQHLFRGAGMFGVAAAGLMGSGIVAREVDNRTAELLLSRPISRSRILMERWFAGAVLLLVPLLATTCLAAYLAPQVEEVLDIKTALAATVFAWLFPLAAFSITMFFSTLFSNQIKAAILVLGVSILQMAFYLIPELWNYSIFNIIDLDVTLKFTRGEFPMQEASTLATVSLVSVAASICSFRRRGF